MGKAHRNRKLNLSNLGLGPMSSKEIAALIQKKQSEIAVLDLSKNLLGSSGISALTSIFKNNKVMMAVDIGANEIGPEGMIEAMKALSYNKSITSISLGSTEALNRNRIESKGCD